MAENIHNGHRTRLRDLVEQAGIDNLPEHQILEFLLTFVIPRKDTNPIAHDLIKTFGSLSGVLDATKDELLAVNGIGENAALFLSTFKDIFSRYRVSKDKPKIKIKNSNDLFNFIRPILENKTCEELYVLCVDDDNRLVSYECIAKGGFSSSSINMQALLRTLLKSKCTHFMLAHNHPSGKITPSIEDDRFTKATVFATRLNNFDFVEHIIVGQDGNFFSYSRSKILDQFKDEVDRMAGRESIRRFQTIGNSNFHFDSSEESES